MIDFTKIGSINDIYKILQDTGISISHHKVFWALDGLARGLARAHIFVHEETEFIELWNTFLEFLDLRLPAFHNEKVTYYDEYAQILVKLKKISVSSNQTYGGRGTNGKFRGQKPHTGKHTRSVEYAAVKMVILRGK